MSNHSKINLVKDIFQDPSFQHYYQLIKKSESDQSSRVKPLRVELKQVIGSLLSFLIAGIDHKKPIIYVCENDEEMRVTESDLLELGIKKVLSFPSLQRRPYDTGAIINASSMVQRTEVLQKITEKNDFIILCSAEGLFDFIQDPVTFQSAKLELEKSREYQFQHIQEHLTLNGYKNVRFVDEPGEIAIRGGILDIYPYSGEYPIRIEFFGNEIESIREFDADSQRSVAFLDRVSIVPDISNIQHESLHNFLDYLGEKVHFVVKDESLILSCLTKLYDDAVERYDPKSQELSPKKLFLDATSFKSIIGEKAESLSYIGFSETTEFDQIITFDARPQPDFNGVIRQVIEDIERQSKQGFATYICCDNQGQVERFEELLPAVSSSYKYSLLGQSLNKGFILENLKLAVYTDHQIFNRYHRPKIKKRRYSGGISFKEIYDLNLGDYVVHVDYGIGKFSGFKKIEVKGVIQEVVVVQYQENSTLYVNLSSLHKLQKYSAKEGMAPRVTKLGSGEWARKKAQTRKKVKNIARDLIELYAKRKMKKAFAYSADNAWQVEMEARFEFEETLDQDSAIKAVKEDMMNEQPMDRLVCGDVGFGKTEVAIRSAFKAVMDNKQVAVLVPTTLLADQHLKTFRKRMNDFPVKVDALSRFKSAKEQKEILNGVRTGEVDILIGTHRILSKDIIFKDLGLIIIDEEQRFGVSAKEKLKELKATVDVLTLTATPIPRTLQFALMGARDLSIITTPPPNRRPVQTEIHSFDETLIKDALVQEISRGGQAFFIHNRVGNIEEMTHLIHSLIPEIRVRYAHGQMKTAELEIIIQDFYNNRFDVLISTNIVENGIDISNANTIIINDAERFGLAELHQLRGRVGRSNRKAFCYLITRPIDQLTPEARKRLIALEEFSDLGSGFNIAMRDLDIRGAGDILGGEQSGFINDIGFELYTKILDEAVQEVKEQEFNHLFEGGEKRLAIPETQIVMDESALLPQQYVSDNVERLNLYRKLAKANTVEEIEDWRSEVEDRFGPFPIDASRLLQCKILQYYASNLYFNKITLRVGKMWCMCPKVKSALGRSYYESPLFTNILNHIKKVAEDSHTIIQKDDAIRFLFEEVDNLSDAIDLLKKIYESQ
ncbi:MAG: transcription-repair coupling factor [Balneola sp.]|nr:transcription-repair coupling factor [Balneola sp.]|tara:strand:+ start:477 stop:3836 length:3360 start_codon:yes stop_codon:yes gene_type:complete